MLCGFAQGAAFVPGERRKPPRGHFCQDRVNTVSGRLFLVGDFTGLANGAAAETATSRLAWGVKKALAVIEGFTPIFGTIFPEDDPLTVALVEAKNHERGDKPVLVGGYRDNAEDYSAADADRGGDNHGAEIPDERPEDRLKHMSAIQWEDGKKIEQKDAIVDGENRPKEEDRIGPAAMEIRSRAVEWI